MISRILTLAAVGLVVLPATPVFAETPAATAPAGDVAAITPEKILADMSRVADRQLAHPSKHAVTDWTQGAFYDGMMALTGVSPDSKYGETMLAVGLKTGWKPGPGKYHADDQCVGRMYIGLGERLHNPVLFRSMRERFDDTLAHPPADADNLKFGIKGATDKWSWCDSLFMAPPTWLRLYEATGDRRYLDYANEYWWKTYDYLFDKDENLYFRDSTYFKKKEANGKKVFWSRGNGWVIAGLAEMLQVLPANHPDRPRYEKLFRDMAAKLLKLQGDDGLWRTSLLDPESFPAPETSGTGFNTFAFARGVNAGLLDRATFGPAARKGWAGLLSHVTPEGMLGSCQPVGADPRHIKETDTDVYGPGAFLLAGAEMYKGALLAANAHGVVTVKNPGEVYRAHETVEIPLAKLKELTGTDDPARVVVFDAAVARLFDTQAYDAAGTGKADTLIFQTVLPAGDTRRFIVMKKPEGFAGPAPVVFAHARFVPERMDDFSWENDRTAHRVYGPALLTGEHNASSGIDVWTKSTPVPVTDARYRNHNYHIDHGDGLDCYDVGESRGCGGDAILADGKWWPAGDFATWKLIADGPIRASFELTYAPFDVAGRKVGETKRLTLDAGGDMTRLTSVFTSPSSEPLTAGLGLVRVDWLSKTKGRNHHSPVPFILSATPDKDEKPTGSGENWVADWQFNSAKNGSTGVAALLLTPGAKITPAEGHWFISAPVKPGVPFTGYSGSGWSKAPHYATGEDWTRAIADFAKAQAAPAIVTFGE